MIIRRQKWGLRWKETRYANVASLSDPITEKSATRKANRNGEINRKTHHRKTEMRRDAAGGGDRHSQKKKGGGPSITRKVSSETEKKKRAK